MQDNCQEFFTAVEVGDVEKVKSYLENGQNINSKNTYNESALNIAVQNEKIEVFRLLLNNNDIDLHTQGYLAGTPLTFAIFNEHHEMINSLLSKENKFDNEEHPGAVSWAVLNDFRELLTVLKEKGANLNLPGLAGYSEPPDWVSKPEPEPDSTPFHREVRPFIEHTPLCLAIYNGDLGLVKYLLEVLQVDPNKPNYNNKLPLQMAIEMNQKKTVELLLGFGANPELPAESQDNKGLPRFLRKPMIKISPEIQQLILKAKQRNNPDVVEVPSFFKKASLESEEAEMMSFLYERFKQIVSEERRVCPIISQKSEVVLQLLLQVSEEFQNKPERSFDSSW